MLETIREYGLEQLEHTGEIDYTHRRHATWYLQLADIADRGLEGADQVVWLARIEIEHDNFRVALSWALEHDLALALGIAGRLWNFWDYRTHLREGLHWLEQTLDGAQHIDSADRVTALNGAGVLRYSLGDYQGGVALNDEAVALARRLGDRRGMARAIHAQAIGAANLKDYPRAISLFQESIKHSRAAGDAHYESLGLGNLGYTLFLQGDLEGATSAIEERVSRYSITGNAEGLAGCLNSLGCIARAQADFDRANRLFRESLALGRDLGDLALVAENLRALALVAVDQRDFASASRLFAATDLLRETTGVALETWHDAAERAGVEAAREQLGEEVFQNAWAAGRAMPWDDVVREVLGKAL